MKKNIYIIVFLAIFIGCNKTIEKEVLLDTNYTVQTFYPIVTTAFNEADKLMKVEIEIEEDSDGQDPDADKCICKGTGRIVQGDGHVTDCRYHKRIRKDSNVEEVLDKENICPCGCEVKDCECTENKNDEISASKQSNNLLVAKNKLIFFTADWCSPCRMQKGELEKLKKEGYSIGSNLNFDIAIIDIDQNKNLYNSFRGETASIPMYIVLEGNVVKERKVGFISKENILGKYYRIN
jgi:thioredoxin 1